MSKSKMIVRTKFIDRACHWTVVICFFLVALSGISFFFPTLQWLTQTFGTPQMWLNLQNAWSLAEAEKTVDVSRLRRLVTQ